MNLGPTTPAIKQPHEYAIHYLTIRMWEWEGILDRSNISISANGPNSHDCYVADEASNRISELKASIKTLSA